MKIKNAMTVVDEKFLREPRRQTNLRAFLPTRAGLVGTARLSNVSVAETAQCYSGLAGLKVSVNDLHFEDMMYIECHAFARHGFSSF